MEKHLTTSELDAGLDLILKSPKNEGRLEMIVRRPDIDKREILEVGQLHINEGLLGDTWKMRKSSRTPDGSPHPDMQLNIMNSRVIALIAQDKDRWQLAGDQLFVDLDLSEENMPPGTQLSLGSALIEVTNQPHRGCDKFMQRFGKEALKWVNSEVGKQLHLRGINAKVLKSGNIEIGNIVKKL
jgi:hypothetical protein